MQQKKLNSIFNRVSNIGILKETIESQFIKSSNRATLIALFITFPYIVIYLVLDNMIMSLVNTTFFLLYSTVFLFNKYHYYKLAKLFMLVIGNFHVMAVSLYYGPTTGFDLYFYLLPVMSIFIFSKEEQKLMFLGVTLFIPFFFFTQYLYTVIPLHTIPLDVVQFLYYFSIISVLFFLLVFIYSFRMSSLIYQEELEKQKKLAEQASIAKSTFLANMSHEIRTPLNAILGFVNLLKDEKLNSKSQQYINVINSSSNDLLHIIEDILDFSKIESGKLDIENIIFNAQEEFQVVTYLFLAKCQEKNISLVLNLDDNTPTFLKSDPLRIKQVITNLLSNAVKFTQEGKTITVDILFKEDYLTVRVKDEGIGILKKNQKHIFEAFSQEDSSTTRKFGGTGLGLTISSNIISLLNGKLEFTSIEDEGSEFYFTIPVEIAESLNQEKVFLENIKFDNKKILLVEDNKSNQMLMKIILKKLHLNFDIANDGKEAIEMFKQNNYNAILMDENMPNMNGIEATLYIRNLERKNNLPLTPIIALTANAIKNDRKRFMDVGMDEYLTKPINKNILGDVLAKYMSYSKI